jgi:hypothetical protein
MASLMDSQNILQTIEILKAAKPLFEDNNSYMVATVGALGAIGGALATFVPSWLMAKHQQRETAKSTAFQLYAEIKATLEVERHRGYIKGLREVLDAFDTGKITSWTYQVQVPNDRYIIYKSNLSNIGLLPPIIQGQVVLLYQLLEAVVQDVKPGGLLNATPVGKEPFAEALRLIEHAKGLAESIMAELEKLHPSIA